MRSYSGLFDLDLPKLARGSRKKLLMIWPI